jgi:ribbon-helix-helix CopG family protein
MPTKADPRITVRLSPEAHATLQKEAAKQAKSVGKLVREAVALYVAGVDHRGRVMAVQAEDDELRATGAPTLHCPQPGCTFTASSPKAPCPHHGYLVR